MISLDLTGLQAPEIRLFLSAEILRATTLALLHGLNLGFHDCVATTL